MKRLILRLIIAFLTFAFSYCVTWVTAYFADEPAPDPIKAMRHVQDIGTAQLQYMVTTGRGEYTDLETLGREGFIDTELASGKKDGYAFISQPVSISPTSPSMFDLYAKPNSRVAGIHILYTNEAFIIYKITDMGASPVSSHQRIPENGIPVQ
jgi:hypothetical protein